MDSNKSPLKPRNVTRQVEGMTDEPTDADFDLYTMVSHNPQAQKAWKRLVEMYYDNPDIFDADELQPYATYIKLGQRDVIGYIKQAIERVENAVLMPGRS